ncbi:MAG: ion transporter [Chryseobacterium sp. 36-9]|nr:MAG: ion transporter [Chryseobacterium sp. 36-9]
MENLEIKTDTLKPFNVIIIVLSIYVLIELALSTFIKPPKEVARVLDYVDDVICIFFLIDFLIRFFKAEDKLKFMKWGWIDLISSIPMASYLRAGRLFRLIRLLRVVRAFRSTKHLVNHIYKNKTQGAFTTVAIIAILMVIFSSTAILQVETSPDSNIRTAEDAIWWAYVTVTTVGYGDKYPVTTEGRIIAALLMTIGVGLFGTFTGFLASIFVEDRNEQIQNK